MQVTDPCRKRPTRGREGLVVGKGIWWWDSLGRDQRTVDRRGQQEGGQIRQDTEMAGEEVRKQLWNTKYSRKFEFTLVGRWDVKREVGSETTDTAGRVL